MAQWRSIYVTKKPSDQWATVGIVDRCIVRKQYMVVRLTDMRGMHAHLFITDKAFDALHDKINKATILGIFEPCIVWSSEMRADVAIQASRTDQLLLIGTSYDLVQCIQYVTQEKQCENMVDGYVLLDSMHLWIMTYIHMIADQATIVIDILNDFVNDPKTHVWNWHQGKMMIFSRETG